MADYLDRIRRLSALLFVASVFLVFLAIQTPSRLPVWHEPIYVLLLLALLTGVFVYRFPWRRYHPNWFLVIGFASTGMIALLVFLSGGQQSIFFPLFVFVVVASGAYYTTIPLTIVTAAAGLGALSYVAYAPYTGEDLLGTTFNVAIYVIAAFLCNAIFRGLERSVEESRRLAATLAALHELDLMVIAGAPAPEFARAVLERLLDVLPYEAGWTGRIESGATRVTWLSTIGGAPDSLPESIGESHRALLMRTRQSPVTGDAARGDDAFGCGGSWLMQALIVAERPAGVLVLRRPSGQAWSQQERAAVARLATQTAVGMERAQWAAQVAEVEAQQAVARMKDDFVSHVSHELRNPLAMLVGGSELIADGVVDAETTRELGQRMYRASSHLERIVDDLLDLARAGQVGWALENAPQDLGSLLEEAVGATVPFERRAHVKLERPAGTLEVIGDGQRLRQIFVNLIGNAVKYSPNGGAIDVSCELEAETATVRVRDEGIGLPPEAMGRLFEKFYRAPNELGRSIPGTGLGLAIVKQLVEAHGGTIRAESDGVGRGSTFVVALPRAQVAAPLTAG